MSNMFSQGKFQVGKRVRIVGDGLSLWLGLTGEIVGTEPFEADDLMALFNKSGTPHYYLVRLDKDETTIRQMEHNLGNESDTPVEKTDTTFKKAIDGIIYQLSQPQNRDLLGSVIGHIGKDDSFMFTFSANEHTLDFDAFVNTEHQLDAIVKSLQKAEGVEATEDFRSMSERYDEYLITSDHAALNLTQSERFDAIVDPFDGGWSGAVYGFVMRNVQHKLRKMMSN